MKHDTQDHEELQALIGRALVEPSFRDALLNGRRDLCVDEFALTVEERAVARAIEAVDLQDFARQLDGWVQARRLRPAVTPFAAPYIARLAAAA